MLRPDIVAEPEQVNRLLGVMHAANPRVDSFIRLPRRLQGDYEPVVVQKAIERGFRVIRWHTDESGDS